MSNKKTKKNKKNKKKYSNKQLITVGIFVLVIAVCVLCVIFVQQDKNWVQRGSVIRKGNQTFKIRDYYDYDETNNLKIEGLTDVKWKVLGVDEGNLLIMSASDV